ncbi:methyl-accepting chemotaxis protein [Marinicrinis lubricantis]|uniref:Methyl-accepting chemotaxis protein n=2 Tax=Paenibacillaceae TaxID=186822 RepID=A0ABW1INT2_9BACL
MKKKLPNLDVQKRTWYGHFDGNRNALQVQGLSRKRYRDWSKSLPAQRGCPILRNERSPSPYRAQINMRQNADKIERIECTFTEIQTLAADLARFSEQIRDVVSHIQEISNQTHLLSLNAAIEAARAGEQGRGFAVVAEEIRKLADQAARSTAEIHGTIELMLSGINHLVNKVSDNSADVQNGVGAMKEAGQSFRTIMTEVSNLSAQVVEVAAAVEQMSAGSKAVETSIREITRITEETASFSEEVAAMTEEQTATSEDMLQTAFRLNEMSDSLRALVGKFNV